MTHLRIIAYRDYWDVPRIFVVKRRGKLILFDCPFDDDKEDFADHFLVYDLPSKYTKLLAPPSSWIGLANHGKFVGTVPVKGVAFDVTGRRWIESAALDTLPLE